MPISMHYHLLVDAVEPVNIISNAFQKIFEGEREKCENFVKQSDILNIDDRDDCWHNIFNKLIIYILSQIFNERHNKLKDVSPDNSLRREGCSDSFLIIFA